MYSSIRIDRDVPMEMRDGVLLRADVLRPEDPQKHPAILFRTIYDKTVSGNSDFLSVVEAAFAGYAVVIQDVRGRYASGGEWKRENMLAVEGPDGYDSVEWIASQSWCDGNVGTAGGSYLAGLQWITAMESPPHLKAIAPWMGGMGTVNRGMQPPPESGTISLSTAVHAIPVTSIDLADKLEREGQDVTDMRRVINWALDNPEACYNFLPLKDIPFTRFERIRAMWNARLHPPVPDAAQEGDQRYGKVTVPCFQACGWYDILEATAFDSFNKMRELGGSQRAREGQHILVGPWPHGRLHDCLGDLNFGVSARARHLRLSRMSIAFFDRYLGDKDIEIPAVRYFLMGSNRWQTADAWPLPQTRWQRFYLHSRGCANTAAGDGLLSRDEPGSEPVDTFVYDPLHPVPSVGGRIVGVGLVEGPVEQSHVEKRSDVLCYTTPELEEPVEVTGPLEMHLFAATSARDTDFTAKLVDVYPDGRSYNLTEGIKRARALKSAAHPDLINPGEVYEYVITMGNTSQLFRKGHRIRIDISSSNFPMFDRNMNTGNPIGEDAQGIPATQTVYHQPGYASYIDLPVITGKSVR